jgi:RsmE family RNA methyltransferase
MLLTINEAPPAKSDLEVILALPRPKVIKRMIENLTSLGIKKITFINSARVERFYWGSDLILPANWQSAVCKGLEQSKDTVEPIIKFERLFKPFVEDQLLKDTLPNSVAFAHPYCDPYVDQSTQLKKILIGPEGGWVDFEIETFKKIGLAGYSFGGWTDGTRIYAGGSSYTPTGGITLNPRWYDMTYTISFNSKSATSQLGRTWR